MGIMNSYSFLDNLSYYLLSFPSVKRHEAHLYLEKLEEDKKLKIEK